MTTGLVLVAAVLFLGGVIATVGDRLGMRIGKARLSLFNLRPRQTATLITILTGIIISASTFGILFAVSDQLRKGVFEYEKIQGDLSTARQDLQTTTTQKEQIEQRLKTARRQQTAAQQRLENINRSLQTAIEKQTQTQQALSSTQAQLQQAQGRFQQAQTLLSAVTQQASKLQSEIQQLQADRQTLIRQRDEVREQIAERDQEIAARNAEIAAREAQLQDLEDQRSFLKQEIDTLEREFQALRLGSVALFRNQTLASGVVRVVAQAGAQQAIDEVLREANRFALQRLLPGTSSVEEQVIQITTTEVEQLVKEIGQEQDYFIRVAAAGNYVVGEPCVLAGEACIQVTAAAVPNQRLFTKGETVATTMVDPTTMDDRTLTERILLLLTAAQFRVRQAGVLADTIQIADNQTQTIINFIQRVKQYNQPLEIQTIAAQDIYVSSVRLDLVALQNGQILFGTNSP